MKLILTIASLVAMGVGAFWVLQGLGVVQQGFMANQIEWAYRGAGLVVVGLVAFVFARRQ
jgi:hypothetical protein